MAFNFGTSTPKTAATGFTLPTNPSTTTPAGTAAPTGNIQFGVGSGDSKLQPKPATLAATPLFNSAATTAATAPLNFGFGTAKTTAPLAFGTPTISTSAPTLPFGTPTGAIAPSLSFGNAATTTAPTLSFGAPATAASGAPSLSFGKPTVSTTTATPSLAFGTTLTSTSAAPSLPFGTTTAASSSAPQLNFGGKPTSVSTTTFTPILGSTTTSTAAGTAITTSAPATSLSFGLSSAATTSAPLSLTTAVAPQVSSTTQPSAVPSLGSTSTLTFTQLEDSINKWTIDLEEQGKFFINQAKQLNAWDSLLISNGEKILNLNGSIEKVKQQQQQLDQELDFIVAQQKELEELIRPLEKELVELPVTDIDRNQMYQFSEIIDSQLKQMSDDLKEIIEHINESNKDEEITNPVNQISRILNAHMNSLQWIDRNTAQISSQLEQISKMQDSNRRNFALNHSLNHSFNM